MKVIDNRLKVFHGLVNYGTQSGLVAKELRKQGHDAISVTFHDKFKRQTDVELKHGGNAVQKILRHSWNVLFKIKCFFKYDIFHFYYGNTLLSKQIDLPYYRLFGKKVVMEYLGGDIQNYATVVERYNFGQEHRFYHQAEKHDLKVSKRYHDEKKYIDLELVCSPCYSEYIENSYNVLNLGIDLRKFDFSPLTIEEKIKILHAPTDIVFKGSKIIEDAVNQLIEEGFPIEYHRATNVTHDELMQLYKNCTLFIDQISIGWYGTAAIEAMAIGRPTFAFVDEIYFKYINYGSQIPIVNITKENCYDVLKHYVINKNELMSLSTSSRRYVENIHDIKTITNNLIDYYNKL